MYHYVIYIWIHWYPMTSTYVVNRCPWNSDVPSQNFTRLSIAQVFAIGSFIPQHPGGFLIRRAIGEDATEHLEGLGVLSLKWLRSSKKRLFFLWYFHKKMGYHSSNHPKSHTSTSSITINSEATILLSLENPPWISMMFRRLLGFHQSKSHQITNHGLTSYTFRLSDVFLLPFVDWNSEGGSVRASLERFRCCWCLFPSYLRWCPMIAFGMDGRQTTNWFSSWWITFWRDSKKMGE